MKSEKTLDDTGLRMVPNEEHKSHDGNYIVGDTESLGCEWWGGVRITF